MAPRTDRGTGFTPLGDLALANAWAVATREGTDQNTNTFGLRLCEVRNESLLSCNSESISRTSTAARAPFRILQRTTNKHLAAPKLLVSSLGSGTSPEKDEIREETTKICREKAKKYDEVN